MAVPERNVHGGGPRCVQPGENVTVRVQIHAGQKLNTFLLSIILGQLHKHLLNIHEKPVIVLGREDTEVSETSFGNRPAALWLRDVSEPAGGETGGQAGRKAYPTLGSKG